MHINLSDVDWKMVGILRVEEEVNKMPTVLYYIGKYIYGCHA